MGHGLYADTVWGLESQGGGNLKESRTAPFAGVAFVTKGGGELSMNNEKVLGIRGKLRGLPPFCFGRSRNSSEAGRLSSAKLMEG